MRTIDFHSGGPQSPQTTQRTVGSRYSGGPGILIIKENASD